MGMKRFQNGPMLVGYGQDRNRNRRVNTSRDDGAPLRAELLWGYFTLAGTGAVVRIERKMDKAKFRKIPMENLKFGQKFSVLKPSPEWLINKGYMSLNGPRQSHDPNPVENLWHDLKVAVCRCSPHCLAELQQLRKGEWGNIVQVCKVVGDLSQQTGLITLDWQPSKSSNPCITTHIKCKVTGKYIHNSFPQRHNRAFAKNAHYLMNDASNVPGGQLRFGLEWPGCRCFHFCCHFMFIYVVPVLIWSVCTTVCLCLLLERDLELCNNPPS